MSTYKDRLYIVRINGNWEGTSTWNSLLASASDWMDDFINNSDCDKSDGWHLKRIKAKVRDCDSLTPTIGGRTESSFTVSGHNGLLEKITNMAQGMPKCSTHKLGSYQAVACTKNGKQFGFCWNSLAE